MTKIRARISPANGAGAVRIGRPLVLCVTCTLNKDASFAGVKASMTRRAGRQHAIHHVDAERDVIRDLLGLSDAHQVARTVTRQERARFSGHFTRQSMWFAYRKSTDGITRKIQLDQLSCAFAPQIGESRSLHDAELPLQLFAVAARLFQKIFSPTRSPFRRAFHR